MSVLYGRYISSGREELLQGSAAVGYAVKE